MSVKHVIEEYNRINASFDEMIETLHDMEELASQNIVSPEQVDSIKQIIEPMKVNKARWDYMIFLLNMPNKKEKRRRYEQLSQKDIERLQAAKDAEDKENKKCNLELEKAVNNVKD